MSWKSDGRGSHASSSSPSIGQKGPGSSGSGSGRQPIHLHQSPKIPPFLQVKSKFDSEWRRFSVPFKDATTPGYQDFRNLIEGLHDLHNIPFTLCYTSVAGDLLPITNDENFRKSFESAKPTLRLLIQRKGESWEEKYGYGTDTIDRKRKGISVLITGSKPVKRNYNISSPEDFRQVSAIIDVDIVPQAHRRVRLCKHGSDRPLGFYIRDGMSVRVTQQGVMKVQGIFISRLVEGGLAESTGLLAVNDEVLEVNGVEVQGKTLDQVTDMMVANAPNLIITVKPANRCTTLQKRAEEEPFKSRKLGQEDEDSDEDEVVDYTRASLNGAR
ncbi:hypothetical protein L596_007649 [Steinernema carpocapsae]|uniref:PDZ domain-containing protein n=1 Tax=Steinernema carpocapsae TaxID=34508 RepID=A0A4U5PA29_STECR|nr:hypothetical protein L596_007649 [Steinernema carpocapsae]